MVPAPTPDKVSVIVCAWTERRWDAIQLAITSVLGQVPAPDELLVVVDHNERLAARLNDSVEALRKSGRAGRTRLDVLANEGRRGLSDARNTGVRAARGDVIAFLDDDARARPGWLAALLGAFDADVIAVGGAAVADWETGARPGWFPPEFDWVVGCSWRGLPTGRANVRNVIGANMAFRRTALAAAGPFHHGLGRIGSRPVGAEETDLSIRARRAVPGGRIVLEPEAVVDHLVPAERASWSYFLARCVGEGRSKAILASRSGAGELGSEAAYVRRVLPRAAGRAMLDAIEGDRAAMGRMAAIAAGLAATAGGFVVGQLAVRRGGRGPAAGSGQQPAEDAGRGPDGEPLTAASAEAVVDDAHEGSRGFGGARPEAA